jgi:uncharacterized protein YciI
MGPVSDAGPFSVVQFDPGPRYEQGRSPREQPFWDEHAVFIDDLAARGRIILAGPFADWTGALLIVRGEVPEVAATFAADPFVTEGVFGPPRVRPWLKSVDERVASG